MAQANDDTSVVAISGDGRYVVFTSLATNLVAGDTNNASDVFVRDTAAGTITRISVTGAGLQGNGGSFDPSISADGRSVAFPATASNLVAGETNGVADVFVRDTVAGTTTRVNVGTGGTEANADSFSPAISADGRYVAFASLATLLVTNDTNDSVDVFVRDRVAGTTARVSVGSGGIQANGWSFAPSISADGRYIAFGTTATNLVANDTNDANDIVVHANPHPAVTGITPSTLGRGTTTPVSITGSGFIQGGVVIVDGPGTTASAVTVVSPTEITANVSVAADAPQGLRNLWVELPGTGPGLSAGAIGACVGCVTVT